MGGGRVEGERWGEKGRMRETMEERKGGREK